MMDIFLMKRLPSRAPVRSLRGLPRQTRGKKSSKNTVEPRAENQAKQGEMLGISTNIMVSYHNSIIKFIIYHGINQE